MSGCFLFLMVERVPHRSKVPGCHRAHRLRRHRGPLAGYAECAFESEPNFNPKKAFRQFLDPVSA